MRFFELKTARDLLDKLGREKVRMQEGPNIDNIFNFYVTAYHIKDYLIETGAMPKQDAEALYAKGSPLYFCRELGNKAKHLVLRGTARSPRPDPDPWAFVRGGGLNSAPLNTEPINAGPAWILQYEDGTEIDVVWHAESVVSFLVTEFDRRGI